MTYLITPGKKQNMTVTNYSYTATFDPAVYRPTFDPNGTLADNLVSGEQQTLTAANGRDYQCIIPLFAPFFKTGLVVVYTPSGAAPRQLVEGIDYNLAYEFLGASRGCAKPIYGGINFLNTTIAGLITLRYQTLGGSWATNLPEITRILADSSSNPVVIAWEQVVDRPSLFPVIAHDWYLTDLVGATEIVTAINGIGQAITGKPAVSNSLLPLATHLSDFGNPHMVDKGAVGLSNVQNYGVATTSQTVDGTATNLYVTPAGLRAALALTENTGSGDLAAHIGDTGNPHSVTKAQVSLGSVDNFATATVAQVAIGTATNLFVTPLGVKTLVNTVASTQSTNLTAHLNDHANPHGVTATQVGLGNADNTSDANKPISALTQTALNLKAPLNSPTFTGVPTAATPAASTSTAQVATTAFVHDVAATLTTGVSSVNNRGGDITLTKADVGLDDVGNFTAVQQSGGTDQTNNKIYLGWSVADRLRLQVDAIDFGNTWPINVNGTASWAQAATDGYFTHSAVMPMNELHKPGVIAGGWYINGSNLLCFGQTNGSGVISVSGERITVNIATGDTVINGGLLATGNIQAFSDPRLKTNITTLTDSTAKLKLLSGVYFTWRDMAPIAARAGQRDIGVLADEVAAVFPEIVATVDAGGEVAYQTVDYTKLIPVLIESIKELSARLDALEQPSVWRRIQSIFKRSVE